MLPEFVDRMRGSKWGRALPGQKGGLHSVPPQYLFT